MRGGRRVGKDAARGKFLTGDTNDNSSSEVTVERNERNVGWEKKAGKFPDGIFEFSASGGLLKAGNKPLPVGSSFHKMVKLSFIAAFNNLNLNLLIFPFRPHYYISYHY